MVDSQSVSQSDRRTTAAAVQTDSQSLSPRVIRIVRRQNWQKKARRVVDSRHPDVGRNRPARAFTRFVFCSYLFTLSKNSFPTVLMGSRVLSRATLLFFSQIFCLRLAFRQMSPIHVRYRCRVSTRFRFFGCEIFLSKFLLRKEQAFTEDRVSKIGRNI